MKKILTILVIVFLAGCNSDELIVPEPVIIPEIPFDGFFVESEIDLEFMGAVTLLVEGDSIFRGNIPRDGADFQPFARGYYSLTDTSFMVTFIEYINNPFIGTAHGVFYEFRIVSEFTWDPGEGVLIAYTEWFAEGWEGLEYNSIFMKE